MHVQGRRWGGVIKERWNPKKGLPYRGSIYDAQPTFESYGVAHGSPGQFPNSPINLVSCFTNM
jgi:hypothetical protein